MGSMLQSSPGRVPAYANMQKRSPRWERDRRKKLAELGVRNPKLAHDAREIGRIREEWVQLSPHLDRTVAELRSEGFSLAQIGHTMFMTTQDVNRRIKAWKARTS